MKKRRSSFFTPHSQFFISSCTSQRIQQQIQVDLAGAEVDDTGAQRQPAVELCAGQKYLALALNQIEQPAVERVQVMHSRRRVAEAGDAQLAGGQQLEIFAAADS